MGHAEPRFTDATKESSFMSRMGVAWGHAIAIFTATAALFLTVAVGASAAPTDKPTIEAFFSSNVTATSADLNALINPNSGPTTYRFEYGPTISYGTAVPVPDGEIPSSSVAQKKTVSLSGLNGGTYHFRVVAENEMGETATGDQTFTFYPPSCPNEHLRQQTGSSFLPDCRAYELVSPSNSGNAILQPRGPFSPLATSPPRFAFTGSLGVIPGAGPAQAEFEDVYVSTRTPEGWITKYVGIPSNKSAQTGGLPLEGPGNPMGVFADLTMDRIVDWNPGAQGLTDVTSGDKWGEFGAYVWDSTGAPHGRLPTNLNEVPAPAALSWGEGGFYGDARPSPDMSHYFFSSANHAFAPGGLTSGSGSVYDNDLETGTVTLISKLPGGENIPEEPGDETTDDFLRIPAVSTDGSHAVIEAPRSGVCGLPTCPPPPGTCPFNGSNYCPETLPSHLYMHVEGDQLYDVTGGYPAVFRGMTPDGSRLFFTSAGQVTADDEDTSVDLFVWEEKPTPTVTRLSTGTGTGNVNGCSVTWTSGCGVEVVQGQCKCYGGNTEAGVSRSDNGIASKTGDVYFISPEKLDGGKGTVNQRNLYVYRSGAPKFVATLFGDAIINRIQVSPDGSHAAFVTTQKLTPYDNTSPSGICTPANPGLGDPATGPRCQEMYTYQPGSGIIQCASCMPDGSAPESDVNASRNGIFMTDDGRPFFSTEDPLVAQDTNGLTDIYEFVENRPQLISSGTASVDGTIYEKVALVGVSADGTDAYFSTLDTLVGQDQNGQFFKFYDARTGGGFPFVPPPAPCAAADECHGPGSTEPAVIPTGTTEFLGNGGNATAKKKTGKKKKRQRHHQKRQRHHRNHRIGGTGR